MVNQETQSRLDRFFDSNLSHISFVQNITNDDVDFQPIWDWMVKNKKGCSSASQEFNFSKSRIEKWIKNTERDITETHRIREIDGITYAQCTCCNQNKVLVEDFCKRKNRKGEWTYFAECNECRNEKRKKYQKKK
jgi:hypothetical protein